MKSLGFKEVPINSIKVGERIREDVGDLDALKQSFADHKTLFHPLVVDKDLNLIAGFRRLSVLKLSHQENVTVHMVELDYEHEFQEIELEENMRRKDMTWQEIAKGQQKLLELKTAKVNLARREVKEAEKTGLHLPEYVENLAKKSPMKAVAEDVGVSVESISHNTIVARLLDDPKYAPHLVKAKSLREAYYIVLQVKEQELKEELNRRNQQKYKEIMDKSELDKSGLIRENFHLGNAIEIIPTLKNHGQFSLVLFDPPYGISIDDLTAQFDSQGGNDHYDDSKDNFNHLMEALIPKVVEAMAKDAWLVMFFAIEHYEYIKQLLIKNGLKVRHKPIIWAKPWASSTNAPDAILQSSYETAIYASKGNPKIIEQPSTDLIECAPLAASAKTHPAQKPVEMLEAIVKTFSLPGALVLDPTAGVGSVAKACMKCERQPVSIELDAGHYTIAVNDLATLLNVPESKVEIQGESKPVPAKGIRIIKEYNHYSGKIVNIGGRQGYIFCTAQDSFFIPVEGEPADPQTYAHYYNAFWGEIITQGAADSWLQNRSNDPQDPDYNIGDDLIEEFSDMEDDFSEQLDTNS